MRAVLGLQCAAGMRSKTFLLLGFLAAAAFAACDDSPGGVDRSASSVDESGCTVRPDFQICEVSSTGTSCKNACTAEEVSLTCTAQAPETAIPVPAASRGCHAIPIPTPSNSLYYCCPTR